MAIHILHPQSFPIPTHSTPPDTLLLSHFVSLDSQGLHGIHRPDHTNLYKVHIHFHSYLSCLIIHFSSGKISYQELKTPGMSKILSRTTLFSLTRRRSVHFINNPAHQSAEKVSTPYRPRNRIHIPGFKKFLCATILIRRMSFYILLRHKFIRKHTFHIHNAIPTCIIEILHRLMIKLNQLFSFF